MEGGECRVEVALEEGLVPKTEPVSTGWEAGEAFFSGALGLCTP